MSDALPCVTVLIPARPDLAVIRALDAVRRLDYPPGQLEILIARGRQPSVQRNAALRVARGELVYFLDDDSLPEPENVRRALAHFEDPNVVMVGGPNICPLDAPEHEQVFALVLASWLAFGPSRARYTPVGFTRATSEKELILCNLIARRDALLALGGFNEALYPNEENALMDQLQQRGGKLIYDPAFLAYRRPRPTLKAFCRMLLTYGRGRAEQFRVHPTPGSALNFVPPLFVVYVVTLPLGLAWLGTWALAPLALYAVLLAAQWLDFLARSTPSRAWRAVPLLVLAHLLYGLGFWRGLFTRLKPPGERAQTAVTLERASVQPAPAS
ncbi:MAG: glycosyltransferase family 2 protein [Verrucomicrobiales bacterium]|nr:glycosyltransferase family 2 protein [Verrucomicrobiales bacterium]